MEQWQRIGSDAHEARFYSGTYRIERVGELWTLWFQPRHCRGFTRRPGVWATLADAKRRAGVLDNDQYLRR